jgi:hypothetical protein
MDKHVLKMPQMRILGKWPKKFKTIIYRTEEVAKRD